MRVPQEFVDRPVNEKEVVLTETAKFLVLTLSEQQVVKRIFKLNISQKIRKYELLSLGIASWFQIKQSIFFKYDCFHS